MAVAVVMTPERENTLRSALATMVIRLNALDIETLNNDEHAWDAVVEEFDGYPDRQKRKRGVMPMLQALMSARNIAENLLATAGAVSVCINILHIPANCYKKPERSWKVNMRWYALVYHDISSSERASSPTNAPLKVTGICVADCAIHKSKGWNIRWSGCHLLQFPRPRSGVLSRSLPLVEAVRILMLRQKASTSRRPNVWRKISFTLRGADAFGLALRSRRCTAGAPSWR